MNPLATPWPRMLVGHVAVDLVDHDRALSLIMESLSASVPLAVASANLDHIHHFSDDEAWARHRPAFSVNETVEGLRWLTLLDGVPLVRRANALTRGDWPKLSGSDLIEPILERAEMLDARVGFLGGMAETHQLLRATMGERHPSLTIAGAWAPSRSELTNRRDSERIAGEIRDAGVDILVVGLGKPQQENWITAYYASTGANVLLAFGAVVDFLAGRIQRVPERLADVGGEWAWRLMLEPRRLSRRYLIQGPPALLRLRRSARMVAADFPGQQSRDSIDRG